MSATHSGAFHNRRNTASDFVNSHNNTNRSAFMPKRSVGLTNPSIEMPLTTARTNRGVSRNMISELSEKNKPQINKILLNNIQAKRFSTPINKKDNMLP
jgi:hypothetical protein